MTLLFQASLAVFASVALAHQGQGTLEDFSNWASAEGHHVRSSAPSLPCTYAVNQVAALVNGTIPPYINGSYFHIVSETGIGKDSEGVGGLLAVHFDASSKEPPTVSFGMTRGTGWYYKCPLHWMPSEFPKSYAGASAVSVNEASGNNTVMVVTAMPETVALDVRSMVTVEAPVAFNGSLGPAQNPFPERFGPSSFGPGHMVTDSNGDVYGMIYMFEPFTGYRIYRIAKGTRDRVIIADVHAHSQFMGKGPAYIHQALALTPSFIVIPEQPLLMPNGTFDWKKIQDGWIDGGVTAFRVLDKKTGSELGVSTAPGCFSWHNMNAWENDTHVMMDITWQPSSDGLNVFSERGHGQRQGYYNGTLARAFLPNPRHKSSSSSTTATVVHLTQPSRFPTPEFGAVNPVWMWRQQTRYIFAATTDLKHIDDANFPLLLKVDTETGQQSTWGRDGYLLGAPLFVPRSVAQGPDSSEGSILIAGIAPDGTAILFIVDADTMSITAELTLPIRPLPGVGLHNHFQGLTSSGAVEVVSV